MGAIPSTRGTTTGSRSVPIPEKYHDLLSRPILCAFTTVNPDGQPHSVPVWCDYDGAHSAPTRSTKSEWYRAFTQHPFGLFPVGGTYPC